MFVRIIMDVTIYYLVMMHECIFVSIKRLEDKAAKVGEKKETGFEANKRYMHFFIIVLFFFS